MNNKLIALAVAGAFAAPMAAQAAPTVYGIGQVEWAQTSNSATGTNDANYVVDNKMGRFGFKGSEDLGEGLKALYTLEFGIETSNSVSGANTIFERETSIGLKVGSAHEIRMGAIKSPYKYMGGVKYDSFVATSLQSREGSTNVGDSGGAMSGGALGAGGFLQNSISYKGNFKPVTVWVATDALDDSADDAAVTAIGVSAKVSSFEFGAANITRDTCTAAATSNCLGTTKGQDSTKVFGSWSKGQHTVRAQIETVDYETATGAAAGSTDYTYLNYQFKMGKHLIDVALGEADQDAVKGDFDTDYTRLAYMYNFSKQTRVFAGIAEADNTNVAGNANDWDTFSVGMTVKF